MSEIRTFGLENRTKFSSDFRCSDFRHSGRSVRSIVRLYYKRPKSELFGNGTTLESAEIQTFGFQTFTVLFQTMFQETKLFFMLNCQSYLITPLDMVKSKIATIIEIFILKLCLMARATWVL